jgi:uncharacterized protein (DUF58 family)
LLEQDVSGRIAPVAAPDQLIEALRGAFAFAAANPERDEADDTLMPAVQQLRRRHAVSVASLREPVLDELLAAPVRDFDAALTRAAGLEYLQARRRQMALLRDGGVQVLDVGACELPVSLINHYWARKHAGAL